MRTQICVSLIYVIEQFNEEALGMFWALLKLLLIFDRNLCGT